MQKQTDLPNRPEIVQHLQQCGFEQCTRSIMRKESSQVKFVDGKGIQVFFYDPILNKMLVLFCPADHVELLKNAIEETP